MDQKTIQERIKKLGLKSARIGGTGSMRMRAKKRRRKPKEEEEEPPQVEEINVEDDIPQVVENFEMNMESLDQEIENLEQQLEQTKN